MTKKQANFIKLLCIGLVMAAFSACLDDNNDTVSIYSTIGSLENTDTGDGYYISTDSGLKLLVDNSSAIDDEVSVNDRLYAEFTFTDEQPQDYDGKILVHYVYKILVKNPVQLTNDNAQEIGDDNISVSKIWTSDGYLNFRFQFFSGGNKTHVLNLVTVDGKSAADDGYLYLEFRHNANYDTTQYPYNGIVSFRTDELFATYPSLKGLKIRVKTYSAGEKIYTLELQEETHNNKEVRLGTSEKNVGTLK